MRLLARSFLAGLSFVVVCGVFVGACSNQAEGDRCDSQNGNDDCEDGLVCTPGKNICCPVPPNAPTTPGCQAPTSPGGEAGIPAEASTSDATSNDATSSDASDTGAADSASDDASDANDDGG